ncbi:Phosphate import ATP-binding protein PstB 3 [Sphingobacterium daejeonense]|nr:Phosphate import ATP-binding protein PstB 3 [Sphingobacterium daejeonense]
MKTKLSAENLNISFGTKHVLKNVNVEFAENEITALIGPSGCGKSTLLRSFNRMHDLSPDAKITGSLKLEDLDLYSRTVPVTEIRKRIGMVFQKANPFPKSIYENIAYGLKINNLPHDKAIIEKALREAFLWEEVKNDLKNASNETFWWTTTTFMYCKGSSSAS